MKARVRGVYTTALTKLLLDHGFNIVQASEITKQRFALKEEDSSPDLDVYDRRDRQGVKALGKAGPLNRFISLLQSFLEDVVVRKWSVTVDGIYKGILKEVDAATHTVLVDIGPAVGVLQGTETSSYTTEQQLLVQVERWQLGSRQPMLTAEIKIPGTNAILIPGRQVKISRKIIDWQTRTRLSQLGEDLATDSWGVLWRTSAANQPPDLLRNEVSTLVEKAEDVMQRAEQVEAPATLWEGAHFVNVEFPALAKKRLDGVRKTVAPTIDGHHHCKASGYKVSTALEMAEKLLEKGYSQADVNDLLRQTIETEFPNVDSWIKIEHVKLDGKIFHLGPALVEAFNQDKGFIRFRRVFKRSGVYDGLKTPKQPDDYAITEAKMDEWHFKTQYFSKEGEIKGTYINLNTPMELYPYAIRYIDLEVDVCIWPDGRVETLDMEKLEEALTKGFVTEKLVTIVKEKAGQIIREVSL
jgi:Ribonuclease G/E